MADALQLIRENKEKHARGEGATHLDLGNCGLTFLPSEALDLHWLESLVLSDKWWEFDFEKKDWQSQKSQNEGNANKIRFLPPTFAQLQLLSKLVIVEQKEFSDLSPIIGLNSLKHLYCYSTQVSDLSALASLNNLQNL